MKVSRDQKNEGTVLKVRGYEKHRCDPDYVSRLHMAVNGMISEFRDGMMTACHGLVEKLTTMKVPKGMEDQVDWKSTLDRQYKWANVELPKLQVGLAKYKTFAVDMLAEDYLIKHVDGCVNHEMALFLHRISNCEMFEIISKPVVLRDRSLRSKGRGEIIGYDIVAKFDNDGNNHLFGTSTYEY